MPVFPNSTGATLISSNLFDINGSGNVVNVGSDTRRGKGIELLLAYVLHEAIHDSDSRSDLVCHPGTREEYIRNITSWGKGEWESEKRAFLMTGPAGAGKSAIARTCAHKIEAAGNLGASFFFYRPSGWNDPKKFIPTIVYQLTTRYPAYHDCIDTAILADRLVLQKAMDIQFRELLVKPLRKLNAEGHGVDNDAVIVVDGLDECATVEAQIQILHLIATSIDEQTTPFLWAFFSRPEPPITSAFLSKFATNISWKLPLTLSGSADSDIEAYLRGSFEVIRAKYSIPAGEWPSEDDIHRLVSRSAGLFVYAVTAIRYIDGLGKGTFGLEERLRAVLELAPKTTDSPFAALDELYRLVMIQIPEGVLSNTLLLLFLREFQIRHSEALDYRDGRRIPRYCFALGLSLAAFHVAIGNLHSVLEVTMSEEGELNDFRFYHRSFQEFLDDSTRSNKYSIGLLAVHRHCLEMIVHTLSNKVDITDPKEYAGFRFTLQAFFLLACTHDEKLGENILQQILQLNWGSFHILNLQYAPFFNTFIRQIPRNWRTSIIRPFFGGLLGALRHIHVILMPERYEAPAYFMGKGDKKGLIVRNETGMYVFSADLLRSVSKKQ